MRQTTNVTEDQAKKAAQAYRNTLMRLKKAMRDGVSIEQLQLLQKEFKLRSDEFYRLRQTLGVPRSALFDD